MLQANLVDCLVLHHRKNATNMGSEFAVLGYSVGCLPIHDGYQIDQDILFGTAIGCSIWIPALTQAGNESSEKEMPAQNGACFRARWGA